MKKRSGSREEMIRELRDRQEADSSALKTRVMNLLKASERTGKTQDELMQWFLDFSRRDLSEGSVLDRAYELAFASSFALLEPQKPVPSLKDLEHRVPKTQEPLIRLDDVQGLLLAGRLKLPSLKTMRRWQALARRKIHESIHQRRATFSLGRCTVGFEYGDEFGQGRREIFATDLPTAFIATLFTLLAERGDRIRPCPGCKKDFVASRKNQDYCSRKCFSRTKVRLRRGTPPERYGKPGRPALKVDKGRQKANRHKK